jgi:hypothetical protein
LIGVTARAQPRAFLAFFACELSGGGISKLGARYPLHCKNRQKTTDFVPLLAAA